MDGPIAANESPAEALRMQFELLEPDARQAVAQSIEHERSSLRGDLLAVAVGRSGTAGGAP